MGEGPFSHGSMHDKGQGGGNHVGGGGPKMPKCEHVIFE